jgi:hypothetical protein
LPHLTAKSLTRRFDTLRRATYGSGVSDSPSRSVIEHHDRLLHPEGEGPRTGTGIGANRSHRPPRLRRRGPPK